MSSIFAVKRWLFLLVTACAAVVGNHVAVNRQSLPSGHPAQPSSLHRDSIDWVRDFLLAPGAATERDRRPNLPPKGRNRR
jgi:hypothetical protein